MIKQLNTDEYWNRKWQNKKHGGKYGENQYHFLKDLLPKDSEFTALDLGCGRGAGIGYLSSVFSKAKFMGVDFAESGIEIAKEKYKDNENLFFKHDDVYKINLDFLNFDYIFMIELLEHLRWPFEVVERFKAVCNKAVYISIPSTNWECDEHVYAYGDFVNPFEKQGAEVIGNIDGRKKLVIKINKER
jgi:2-polyprenyl-3-methyl-5-hydroxy-6-metoxy-1,4-benzoquinol methylase